MEYYKKHFKAEIARFSLVALFLMLLANIAELIFNSELYPVWINSFTIITVAVNVLLLIIVWLKRIDSSTAFVVLAYVFTFTIYVPAFWGDAALKQFVISAFTNLGACFTIVVFTGFLGNRINSLILGFLNVVLLIVIYLPDYQLLTFDFINVVIFMAVTIALSAILKSIENTLKEHEQRQILILDYQKQLSELNWKEEQKRVSFLNTITENNTVFLKQLTVGLTKVLSEKKEQRKTNLLLEQIRACKNQQVFISQLEFGKKIRDIDSEFYNRLKNKHPELSGIEQHLCSLLRYGLSSVELATQLNKSVETIKWYRKRIRKKMNLHSSINLTDFCNQI